MPIKNSDTGAQPGSGEPGAQPGAESASQPGAGDEGPKSMLEAVGAGLDKAAIESGDKKPPDDEGEPPAAKPGEQPAAAKKPGEEEPADKSKPAAKKPGEGEEPAAKTAVPGKPGAEPEGGEQPSGEPAKSKEGADPLDELLVIPPAIRGKEAREAYKKLADAASVVREDARQLYAGLQRADQALDGVVTEINTSKAKPEQMADMFIFLKHINHGEFDKAIEIVERERTNLYKLAGKPIPATGGDPLEGFPDLAQKVEKLELSAEAAKEIADHRRREKAAADADELRRQRESSATNEAEQQKRQREEHAKAINTAKETIAAFFVEKKKTDIDFTARDRALSEQMANEQSDLNKTLRGSPPALWPQIVQLAYNSVQVAPQPSSKPGNGTQSLRPGGQGGGKPEPTSMLEAIQGGLNLQ